MTLLIVREIYKKDFDRIIQFLIEESPNKMIMFLADYQSYRREILQGVIRYKNFHKLLNESKIYFNTCYIISD
jgi:hypothetical protein